MKNITILVACLLGCTTNADTSASIATVRAYEEGLGAAGRIAVFGNANGSVLHVQATDHLGIASAPVAPMDMVTIANVGAPKFELTTYVDIAPGDEMVIGETDDEGTDGIDDAGAVTVALSDLPAGTHAEVGVGRSLIQHDGSPLALHLSRRFFAAGSPMVQVLGVARDDAGVARAFSIGQASGAGAVTLPAWRTDWDRIAFSLSGVSSSTTLAARADVLQGEGRFPLDAVSTTATSFELAMPRGLGSELEYQIALHDGSGTRLVRERSVLRRETSIDAGALLPAMTAVGVLPSIHSRPYIVWSLAGASRGDFVMVQLTWGDGAHRWTIVLPATHAHSFRLPELPDSLAGWRPAGELQVGAALVELSSIESYHDLMKRGIDELGHLDEPGSVQISSTGALEL